MRPTSSWQHHVHANVAYMYIQTPCCSIHVIVLGAANSDKSHCLLGPPQLWSQSYAALLRAAGSIGQIMQHSYHTACIQHLGFAYYATAFADAQIYSKTRLNIHPCLYDAYGMTVVEAASQGECSLYLSLLWCWIICMNAPLDDILRLFCHLLCRF